MISAMLPVLQMILAIGNICIIAYGFYKFLGKPHSTLEARVTVLESEIRSIKQSTRDGDRQIAVNAEATAVMQRCLLALIEFEISYCLASGYSDTKDLEEAKRELHNYLAKK